jgi:carbonic anhydrase
MSTKAEAVRRVFHGHPVLGIAPKTQNAGTDTLVLCCVDFRFWPHAVDFVKNDLGIAEFDFKTAAGTSKPINSGHYNVRKWVMETVELLMKKHGVKRIILFTHFDCAAYGGHDAFISSEHELNHLMEEVRTAMRALGNEFVGLQTEGYVLVELDGGESIGKVKVV